MAAGIENGATKYDIRINLWEITTPSSLERDTTDWLQRLISQKPDAEFSYWKGETR
jgi:hypothetical protein